VIESPVWHPRWYVWAALGFGALALIHERAGWLLHGDLLLVTFCLLVVLLYGLRRLWELPVAIMMCMAVVLTIFSGSWGNLGLPGFPFLPDRILIVGVLIALALKAPGTRGRPAIKVRPVHLILLLLTIYAVVSAVSVGTIGSKSGIFDLLDRLGIIPFAMLLLAPVIFHGAREREMLLVTLVGLGAYLGLTAIFESLGPHALVFPHYIVISDETLPGARAGGPFRSSVTEGFATFSCGAAAVIAFFKWSGQRRYDTVDGIVVVSRLRRRYFAAAVVVVSTLGCFLTLERGVWIAATVAALGTGLMVRKARRWLIPAVLSCGVLVGGALQLSPALASKTSARVNDERSVWDRENQTSAGLRMIAAKPLFGFGWDRYVDDSLPYFRETSDYPMTGYSLPEEELPLHNSYLSYAVELGLVGMALWLLAVLWGLGGAIFSRGSPQLRPWKLGLLAMTIFFFVIAFFDPLQQNFTELLLWTWAGLALADSHVLRARPSTSTARSTLGKLAGSV
jgi:putative inorganic carbon (hco3(-)) transporter